MRKILTIRKNFLVLHRSDGLKMAVKEQAHVKPNKKAIRFPICSGLAVAYSCRIPYVYFYIGSCLALHASPVPLYMATVGAL